MTSLNRMIVGAVFLTALAAAAGGWMGIQYGLRQVQSNHGLDEILHDELDLTPEQEQRIGALESAYAARREELTAEMRSANRDLAAALATEHDYGARAEAAIDRFHSAERTLQIETVKHVMAMRGVLSGEQRVRFDEAVSAALTSD